MTDLQNSVIMPREDFIELSQVAFDNAHVPTFGERAGQITQTTMVLGALTGAFVMSAWGWAKAMDWFETRKHDRNLAERQFEIDNRN
jgi:hypothetical protein